IDGIILTEGSAEPWGPKCLRASTGSIFRVPSYSGLKLKDVLDLLRKSSVKVFAAASDAKNNLYKCDWSQQSIVLAFGSEGSGFNSDESLLFEDSIRIPMNGKVESLNVSHAAAICMFEIYRQRSLILK
ncbi:MAG: TrmH family RNA methyltransferase, partial [Elusimicrobiota bacterium]